MIKRRSRKRWSCTGLEFIADSLRILPPCEGGVRGGGPGGTRAWYAVPGRLGQAGDPSKARVHRFGRRCWLCPVHPP